MVTDAQVGLDKDAKWERFSFPLRQNGRMAFSYATLQDGMSYFSSDNGYIAYVDQKHPVFAPRGKKIVLSDPICSREDAPGLVDEFLDYADSRAVFTIISPEFSADLRDRGFKVNCLGYEPVIDIQNYNFDGNWKELHLLRRAKNEAKKHGIRIEEMDVRDVNSKSLEAISSGWLSGKQLSDREIWMYARPAVYDAESDVRKFFSFDNEDNLVGFAFYDPMYRDGDIVGYSANIVRGDESRFRHLSVAMNSAAGRKFKEEGKESLNLCIAPFDNVDAGEFNDDFVLKTFLKTMRRFGERVYNFGGLSSNKARYKAEEVPVYFASNGIMPVNDIYLAFLSSKIAKSYPDVLGKLGMGFVDSLRRKS
jgi:lysylphosphatidylglycerol synthetase-like protein (DUF2156 family)